jgi:hypothetical protein
VCAEVSTVVERRGQANVDDHMEGYELATSNPLAREAEPPDTPFADSAGRRHWLQWAGAEPSWVGVILPGRVMDWLDQGVSAIALAVLAAYVVGLTVRLRDAHAQSGRVARFRRARVRSGPSRTCSLQVTPRRR